MSNPRLPTLKPRLQTPSTNRVAVLQPGSWRSDKQGSTARGYGYAWQKARAGHLRNHPFCVFCMRDAGIVAATIEGVIIECATRGIAAPYASVVDHMDPHRGDMKVFWDASRWQSLCSNHHSAEKQRIESRRRE